MLQKIPLKCVAQLLLVLVLLLAANGMHERAHASEHGAGAAAHLCQDGTHAGGTADGHGSCDGCNVCLGCACQAPLPVPCFTLAYAPIIVETVTFEPFRHLPEVYLSKFIPPQNRA